MEPEHAAEMLGSYINADYYRTVIGVTKGRVGHEELLQRISEARRQRRRRKAFPFPIPRGARARVLNRKTRSLCYREGPVGTTI